MAITQSFCTGFCLAGLSAAVDFELCMYKQTMCTRLPCFLLTQEPGIKANIYAVMYIIVHADTSKKISITWVVEMQPNSYNIHATPIQHLCQ